MHILLVTIAVVLATAVAFAGSAFILRIGNIRRSNHRKRLESRWASSLTEVLSGLADPSLMRGRVAPGEELYFIDFIYRQARVREGEARAILARVAHPYIPAVAARMVGGDPERRARAVQTVSVLAFPRYAPQVLAALDDPSPLVSMVAARALARERRPEHVSAVVEWLPRFEDWSARFVTSVLASMGEVGVPALRDILASNLHPPWLRAVCAEALHQLYDAESADIAASVVAQETDRDLLAACLRLLRKTGSSEQLPALRALVDSPDFAIRAQAISAIGRLGGPADDMLLRRGLEDPSPWVALHAARALRARGHGNVLRAIAVDVHQHMDIALQVLGE